MAETGEHDGRAIGTEARGLIRRAAKAAFATIGAPGDTATQGWPSAALVTIACAMDGSPIVLLSTLAHHTRNLLADPRASLLIDATDGFANPQAGPRVAAMGRIERSDDPAIARRFLARHPAARGYAGFGDFAFYRMKVERLHYVGGFARARWIEREDAVLSEALCRGLTDHEHDILAHMNEDHAETLLLFAHRLVKSRAKTVHLIAVDPEGFDLRCGRANYRVDFPDVATGLSQLRAAFVTLAQSVRVAGEI